MKKIFPALVILFITFHVSAQQAGRVKVSFAGFKCMKETADDILHLDGKADEVFLRFYFTVADKTGNMKLKYSNQSDLYGDNHGIFGNRINAGSAVDLFGNLKGGIRAGDNYFCNNIIGEYDLAAGDVLTVVPTIWEWDPGNGYESSFDATIDGAYTIINQKASSLSNQRFATAGAAGISAGDVLGLVLVDAGPFLSLKAAFGIVGELIPKPRPIGITTTGDYSPKAVLLNANIMQHLSGSNFGYGTGVIPIQYNEEALGNARDHGNYIVLIKVEFTPKPVAGATPPPPPPPKSGGVNKIPPTSSTEKKNNSTQPVVFTRGTRPPPARALKTSPTNNSTSVAGTWTGTYGNGESDSPNFYSFVLNDDGTMKVMAANGNVMAQGKYSVAGTQLTGSYTYANGSVFSFAAAIENNSRLNGTWGSGSNVRGGGKWVMIKK